MGVPPRTIAIKIDVDTRQGMERGVPRLLDSLKRLEIPASFFLSFGPDKSGQAIWNIFKQKGFLKKMLRTNALKMYGWRTILSGTLLPARPIASDYPELVRRIGEEGHEVGVHAWDHRRWQDKLTRLSAREIRSHLERAAGAFEKILGRPTRSIAAPSWRVNGVALGIEDEMGLLYASDSRGSIPFFPKLEGRQFSTPQFPTTMPCIEELVTTGINDDGKLLEKLHESLDPEGLNVLPAHAEVEGTLYAHLLEEFVGRARVEGYRFLALENLVRETLETGPPEIRHLVFVTLPGRAGLVAAPAA